MHTKLGMKPLLLLFLLGALIICSATGLSLGFAHADLLHFNTEMIANPSSEALYFREPLPISEPVTTPTLFLRSIFEVQRPEARDGLLALTMASPLPSTLAQTHGPLTLLGRQRLVTTLLTAMPRSRDHTTMKLGTMRRLLKKSKL
jgi:hypothetical protein